MVAGLVLATVPFLPGSASAALNAPGSVDGGRYGPVEVTVPGGDIRGYVVLFPDPAGHRQSDRSIVNALTREGALVVEVDTPAYLANLVKAAKPCDQLVGDAEMLSRQLQHVHPTLDYMFPILVGLGESGTLVYATLAQAPNNTLSGAVSLDPKASLRGAPPLCPGAEFTPDARGSITYGPKVGLQGFWAVAWDSSAQEVDKAHIDDLKRLGTSVEVTNVGAGDASKIIADLVAPHLSHASSGGVASLPLVELPADKPSRLMAVVLSGDGGWRDIDKTIADNLQRAGVSVVGWDSLRYFWHEKTPDETAADLAAVLGSYSVRWHADKIALIGYSFGADVLPFAYNRLPAPLRAKVAQVSLLGLEDKADWQITVSGWLGEPPSDAATPVRPALEQMPAGLIQCFYGDQEKESACPNLAADKVEIIRTAGGHHFGHDYVGLTNSIMEGFQRRAAHVP